MLKRRHTLGLEEDHIWLTSYADLISAILAVLVLFVSFSRIDVDKFDMVQRLMSDQKACRSLRVIHQEIQQLANEAGLDKQIHMDLQREGLEINQDTAALFSSGSSRINPNEIIHYEKLLGYIAEIGEERYIDIAGHTDDIPIKRAKYPSNWYLSSSRAASMHEHLASLGMPEEGVRLNAYGSTQPLVPIDGLGDVELEAARAKNRRVSITIRYLKPKVTCAD